MVNRKVNRIGNVVGQGWAKSVVVFVTFLSISVCIALKLKL